jgi:hypothetical protein
VGPVDVSGGQVMSDAGVALQCSTAFAELGRKTAIDDSNNLYVAMLCAGTTGPQTFYVTSSQNGGISYGTPVSTGLTGTEGAILVGTGATPSLFAATTVGNGPLLFSMSSDLGKTWSAPQTLAADVNQGGNEGVSMALYQSTLYIGVVPVVAGANYDVFRNGIGIGDAGLVNADDAGFSLTTLDLLGVNLNDMAVDPSNGNVWAIAEDEGTYHVALSVNGGLTFGAATSPTPSGALDSDWLLGKSFIFGAGSSDPLYAIPTNAPTTDNTVAGLGVDNTAERSIAIDANGNVYVATGTDTVVTVSRILYAQASADAGAADASNIQSVRTFPGAGGGPTITARPANAALLAYTVQGHVFAATLAY